MTIINKKNYKLRYNKPSIRAKKIKTAFFMEWDRFFDSINLSFSEPQYLAQYCGGCFPAGAKIQMADGSIKPIEEIKANEMVFSYDLPNKSLVKNRVIEKLTHPNGIKGYLIINDKLRVTGNHPIFSITESVWKRAEQLNVNDTLVGMDGQKIEVKKIEKKDNGLLTVYNLHLEKKEHNFFVGGILAHNGDPGTGDKVGDHFK